MLGQKRPKCTATLSDARVWAHQWESEATIEALTAAAAAIMRDKDMMVRQRT